MKIMLCGRKKCCPCVEQIDDGVIIEDKGVKIKFTVGQWEILKDKIRLGEL